MNTKLAGLSKQEVEERRRAGLTNVVKAKAGKSVGKIIASNIFTYFNLMFALIAALLFTAGSPIRNYSFLPVVIANSLIGIIQELRAKRVLDKLQVVNTPVARVRREGQTEGVPVTELVKDDTVFLKAGDQIPADAEVLEGEVSVNEALLTGESDEIIKKPGAALMSGSFVVFGECYARLTKVGDASYAAELTLKAKAIKTGEQSEIIASLNKFVWMAGIAIVPIGILMVVRRLMSGASYASAIEGMVAAVIGMIPEGLFLLASVTLVLSAMRLARQQVLLHDMKCIETLARVDVLCVDKTGTITSGKMRVKEVIDLGEGAETALAATVQALAADSETMAALKEKYRGRVDFGRAEKVQGFSSRLKYSGVDFGKGGTYVLGAPELVLRDDFEAVKKQVQKLSGEGYRVLVFAKYAGKLENQPLNKKVSALALIVVEDEIRESAVGTFRYFAEQGVRIKVISGDAPLTVSAIAKRAGIQGAENYIDLSERLTDKELARAASKYTVFGRVTPSDKRRLVKALQDVGRTVAMTGDGVNDVLALKDADCSVAMASGAQAAAQAAQMVLIESDFSRMPSVVGEGRRVVNNLERSGSLFIVKNLVSLIGVLIVIPAGIAYPMIPAQVSLISLWAIGLPSFLLAQIPNTGLIKGTFIKNILKIAIPTAVTSVVMVVIGNLAMRMFGIDHRYIGTVSTLIWVTVGLVHLFLVARPWTKISLGICFLCLAGVTLSFTIGRFVFGLESMGLHEWLIALACVMPAYPLIMLNRKILAKVWK